jgi:hypothetical protein
VTGGAVVAAGAGAVAVAAGLAAVGVAAGAVQPDNNIPAIIAKIPTKITSLRIPFEDFIRKPPQKINETLRI